MTWSILARDPATGALGAAVATRFFAVGALAIHVEGGVAALATQALINPMYALHGMARLRAGEPPDTVAAALLAADAGRDHRQLHMIDAQDRVAQYTGKDCVAWCGSVQGADVSVAGNMLAGTAVVERTLDAFHRAAGPLAEGVGRVVLAGLRQMTENIVQSNAGPRQFMRKVENLAELPVPANQIEILIEDRNALAHVVERRLQDFAIVVDGGIGIVEEFQRRLGRDGALA